MTRRERRTARKPKQPRKDVLGRHWRNLLGFQAVDLERPPRDQPKRKLAIA